MADIVFMNTLTLENLEARLKIVEQKLGILPPEPNLPSESDEIEIDNLSVKLESGKKYKLKQAYYQISDTIKIPSNTTLNAQGSEIKWNKKDDWTSPVEMYGESPKIIGGTWSGLDNQRVITLDNQTKNAEITSVNVKGTIGLVAVYGTKGTTVSYCKADKIYNYFVYGEGAEDLKVLNCAVTTGSIKETPLRFHNINKLTVKENTINATIGKKTSIRCHDGNDFLIENNTFVGNVGSGPLGGGDGGTQWGFSWWINDKDEWVTDKSKANQNKTMQKRKQSLAARLKNITWNNNIIIGPFCVNAGVIGIAKVIGGVIDNRGQNEWTDLQQPFNQLQNIYPNDPKVTLPTDEFRPPSVFELTDVKMYGEPKDLTPFKPEGWKFTGCKYNDKQI